MFQIELSSCAGVGAGAGAEGVFTGDDAVTDGPGKAPFNFSTRSWSARRVVLRGGPEDEDAPPMRSYFDLN